MNGIGERLRRKFRPYVGRTTLEHLEDESKERDIVCVVTRLQNFDILLRELNLRSFALAMNQFYASVAEAAMQTHGDIDRFCGSSIVINYVPDEDPAALTPIGAAFRNVRDFLETDLGLRVGVGICRGTVIVGRFGTPQRLTVTTFGTPVACADRLADEERTLAMCEQAFGLLRASDPLLKDVSVHSHWGSPQQT
jgi:class 3 adenylate cyclase